MDPVGRTNTDFTERGVESPPRAAEENYKPDDRSTSALLSKCVRVCVREQCFYYYYYYYYLDILYFTGESLPENVKEKNKTFNYIENDYCC